MVQPFLRGLVVVGSHDQDRIRSRLFGMLGEFDRLARRVRTGARYDGYPPSGLPHAPLDHEFVLLVRERRAFAGGANWNQAAGALRKLPVDEAAQCLFVDGTVRERRHQCREGASKAGLGSHRRGP